MNNVRLRRSALTLAVMAACVGQACADTFSWLGGTDGDFATDTNWQGGAAPTSGTDATLVFSAATVGAGEKTITNAIVPMPATATSPATPTYYALQFTGGDFNLSGNLISLRPFATPGPGYFTQVLYSSGGNTTISAPLQINPNLADWILSEEGLNNASINVNSGSLSLTDTLSASLVNLTTYVGTGASLNLNTVGAKSFTAYGGNQNLTGVLSSNSVNVNGSNFVAGGASGALHATVGVNLSMGSSQLTLDNTSAANDNRLAGNVTLGAGSTLLLKGNATTAVDESAGDLKVNGTTGQLTRVKVEGAGADASLTFNKLTLTGLVDFSATGALGGAERIKFTTSPTTVDGLITGALVNGQEFATYDATEGVKSATSINTLSGASVSDNVFISAADNVTGNASINSLAVNDVSITSTGTNTLTLGSGKLLTTGSTSIAPAIDFGSKAGQIVNFGDAVLAGGVNGSNGLSVQGSGSLALQSAGNLSGNFSHTGQLTLSANDALQGASVSSNSGMDIGSTTQHFQSFTGGNVTGTGTMIAATDILLDQSLIDIDLQGQNVTVGSNNSSGIVNGDIQASQTVKLYGSRTVNGVISGAASVARYGNGVMTFTNQNTYTGSTSGNLSLTGNGSIADSSGFSGNLSMLAVDGDNGSLNRIGDSAGVTLNSGTLSLTGQGSTIDVSEDIGILTANGASRLELTNSASGSTSLRADSLSLGSGASLLMSLGGNSGFYVDTGPGLYAGTNVVKDVYVEKSINGGQLPSWAAYDSGSGRLSEAVVTEKSLSTATSSEFVRITDAVNAPLNANRTVGGVNVDTTQTMNGSGTLTVGSGQLLFWKNNTIAISGLDFGAQKGVITNAGTNTISSVISGSNGLKKVGDGTLVLTANNNYTGTTLVEAGKLDVNGGHIGGVDVANGASLELRNGGVATLSNNNGTVDLRNAYTNMAASTINGGGLINAHAGLTNQGEIYGTVSNAGTGSITNSNFISSVGMTGSGSLNNTGTIGSLSNDTNFTNQGVVGFLSNAGAVTNNATVNGLSNSGTFTNNGTLKLDYASLNGTVTNAGTATLSAGSYTYSGSATYTQTSGTTTINGDMYNDVQIDGGILKGSGRLLGNLTLNGGSINPGNSPGLFTVDGDVFLGAGASLNLEVTSLGGQWAYDQLVVKGTFTKQGTINVAMDGGVTFEGGEFKLGGQSLSLGQIFSNDLLTGLVGQSLMIGSQDVVIDANFLPIVPSSTSAVPLPGAVWMLGSGLLGLMGMARRKSKAA